MIVFTDYTPIILQLFHLCFFGSGLPHLFLWTAVDTTGLIITSVTCCGQEAQSVPHLPVPSHPRSVFTLTC